MAVSNVHTLAMAVVEACRAPVTETEAVEFLRPFVADFNIPESELVRRTARAMENQFEENVVESGGLVIEYEGELRFLDGSGEVLN